MVHDLMSGAIVCAGAVAGLFFFRFWWSTRDRFFLYFSASFWIETASRLALGLLGVSKESEPLFYCLRILAYGLIVVAILRKNRAR